MSHHGDLTSLLADLYASFASGDTSVWEDHFADDVLVIGTDEAEWVEGKEAFLSVIRAQLSEMSSAGISVEGGTPVAAEHGDLVTISDRPTMSLPDGTTQALRITLAGRQVDGEVLVHQMHLSVPAPNQEVLQTELTLPS